MTTLLQLGVCPGLHLVRFKFDLIVLIVNFSCSVPNKCSSAGTTRHFFSLMLTCITSDENYRKFDKLTAVFHLLSCY